LPWSRWGWSGCCGGRCEHRGTGRLRRRSSALTIRIGSFSAQSARIRVMRHPIDPRIDSVFKALLGAESNRALLIHFLNAMLGAELPQAHLRHLAARRRPAPQSRCLPARLPPARPPRARSPQSRRHLAARAEQIPCRAGASIGRAGTRGRIFSLVILRPKLQVWSATSEGSASSAGRKRESPDRWPSRSARPGAAPVQS